MGNLTSFLPMVVWFVLSGLVTYLVKSQDNRIQNLEKRMLDMQTQDEVRQMMNDNLIPIRDDVSEIKVRLNQLFNLYLHDTNNKN
jgi:hypothetical protein